MRETLEQLQEKLESATSDILAAKEIADQDEARPKIHFHSPAQWMDDPNGIIYHKGYYHMMYSLNPNTSLYRAGMVYKTKHRVWDPDHEDWTGGITVWGHARSKDLIHWEHLPTALYPMIEKGEHFIWFGTTSINDNGTPVAIYTSVGPDKRPEDTADQWLWFGDEDLIHWKPAEGNPVLNYDLHGDENLTEWRDPFIVKNEGKTYLILGAKRIKADRNDAVVALYEAQNAEYTRWQYKGVIFSVQNEKVPSCECPNLVKLRDKWVILISPHGAVEYYVGNMDFENAKFEIISNGIVDNSTNYYATNIMEDDKNRKIMYGALEGFQNTKGWNGCISFPRMIDLSEDNKFVQRPVEELKTLRKNRIDYSGKINAGQTIELMDIIDGTAEINIEVRCAAKTSLIVDGDSKYEIFIENGIISFNGKIAKLPNADSTGNLVVYIDRTVFEIYLSMADCLTVIVPAPILDAKLKISAASLDAECIMEAYELASDGLFSSELFK